MVAHIARFRRLTACLLLVVVAAVVLACGGVGDKSVVTSTVKLNEELVFNDCTWVVLVAKDMGKSLKTISPDDKEKKTDGRFILVRYKVSNTSKQEVSLGNDPVLKDDQDRTFEPLNEQKSYLPKEAGMDDNSGQIPVGTAREFQALYEVPADAKGLRLNKRLFQEDGFIELGL